jgi:3-oxoacyl-[acyl-carrier-protein] synthase-1
MSFMQNPVCIVGIGAFTAIGLNAPSTAVAVRAGIANFNEHPYMIDRGGEPYIVAMVPTLEPQLMGTERYIHLALPALNEALAPLTDHRRELVAKNIEVKIGIPEFRPGFPEKLQSRLTEEVGKISTSKCVINKLDFVAKGHAAGLMMLETASQKILKGACEFWLVGGVDSYIDPDTLDWLEDNEQVHNPSNAWGFIPGEAASFCLLCLQSTAKKYNLPVKARLVAISTAFEKNKIKTETVCIGQGLTQAVRECVRQLPQGCQIDFAICDQNGEAYRADEFGFMLARLSEFFIDSSAFLAPADCWGDVGAASGPLFINLLIPAAEKGYAKGSHTLLWTSSEGGERTAAIFNADIKERGTI